MRKFDDEIDRPYPIVILPGGRWAIMFAYNGDALAIDLHTPDHRYSLLFRDCTEICQPIHITAVLQTPETGFHTQLKMGVFSTCSDGDVRVQVWLIQLSYDAVGHVGGLTAALLSSFSGGFCSVTMRHSLSGSFLGYLFQPEGSWRVYAVTIDLGKSGWPRGLWQDSETRFWSCARANWKIKRSVKSDNAPYLLTVSFSSSLLLDI